MNVLMSANSRAVSSRNRSSFSSTKAIASLLHGFRSHVHVAARLLRRTSVLNNRSAVSVNGSDLNACTVASPCRSFNAAIAETAPSGEIVALDSAGYGPFTVTMDVTISGAPGVHAAITATSTDAITISVG